MIYLISCLFTIFFVFYSKYQFKDLKQVRNIQWKVWGVAMRVLLFLGCYAMQFFPSHWKDYLLAGSLNIALFEWGINVIALNAPSILWAGYSSKIDNALGKWKWYIMGIFILITILIKIYA